MSYVEAEFFIVFSSIPTKSVLCERTRTLSIIIVSRSNFVSFHVFSSSSSLSLCRIKDNSFETGRKMGHRRHYTMLKNIVVKSTSLYQHIHLLFFGETKSMNFFKDVTLQSRQVSVVSSFLSQNYHFFLNVFPIGLRFDVHKCDRNHNTVMFFSFFSFFFLLVSLFSFFFFQIYTEKSWTA